MTKFKKVLGGALGLYMYAALSLAHAQNAPGPDGTSPPDHPGQHFQEIFNQLNLTDDQKRQLDANKEQHRIKMESARRAMDADKEAIQQELMKPQLDMAKINGIHNQIKALLDQMEDNKLSSILAVRAILTPDQFLKFVNLMHKHKPKHED